ncbi:tyrosine-type recombinase/integrase [Roseicella aerolata]|uniref:Site-specific integrase n=1 Tax=Roseicella aerolata TaxID=2883479 RepID=A0A9X1IIJ5_9PROT|nr:tyrosine-type recombinase/integrase [Roseicella aerolata]MCB4825531.1 site-specific integrase [Roseicella aerolata]
MRRLTPDLWPRADRAAWERAIRPGDGPFDPPGPAAHLASGSKRGRAGAWGNFLAFLETRSDLDAAEGPAERLTYERFTAWLEALRQRTSANTVRQLVLSFSLAIAAMVPERDWSWVRQHIGRPRHGEAMASRKPVVSLDPVLLVSRALALCDAADAAPLSRDASVDHRDGLMLALTIYIGLRCKNIAGLRLGETVLETGDGYRLTFASTDIKNGVTVDLPLPATLVPYLRRHIEEHRPRLLDGAPDQGWLFISERRRPLAYNSLWEIFQRRGIQLLGHPINPHAIRHTIATGLLVADPRAVKVTGAALAHRGTRSVNEIYDRSGRTGAEAEWRRLRRSVTGRRRQ